MLTHLKKRPKTLKRQSKEQIFCAEYLKDHNATKAAIAAGYSEKGARTTAYRLLKKPYIKAILARKMDKHIAKLDLSKEKTLRQFDEVARVNMGDYLSNDEYGNVFVDLSKMTREQSAAIQEVSIDTYIEGRGEQAREVKRIRFKLYNKIHAGELIGKAQGIFVDKLEVTGLEHLSERMDEARRRANEKG